jgi:hypothetical protein
MHPRIPIFLPFAALIVFSGCRPATPLPTTRKTPPAAIPAIAAMIPTLAAAPSPSGPAYPILPSTEPTLVRKTIDGIGFEGVSFDSRTHRLAVVDQPGGPGSEYETASEVARRQHALLAINAGFFTPEGKPLGLLVSEGKAAGAWNSASSLGNGIFKQASNGTGSISRRSSRAAAASNATQLLQAGPLLLENGNRIHGLDGSKTALRSIILTDGGQRWWIGKTSPCTLAALGSALALASPTPWKIRNALNLDGGRSTDLFISSAIPGGPVNRRGFLNRPVRNFLILTAR